MSPIRSMTGFGRAQGQIGRAEFNVEIKSVNSRYLDLKLRVPSSLAALEQSLHNHIKSHIDRGRVECSISESTYGEVSNAIDVNWPVARRYMELFEAMKSELSVGGEVNLSLLARQKDIFVSPEPPDPKELLDPLKKLIDEALAELTTAREREGADLVADVLERCKAIEGCLGEVREARPETVEKLREKLRARLAELKEKPDLDEQRFAQEVAYLADKADITEEIVRLESHIAKFRELIESGGTVGRKLDFLVQEFNREANTIASKASNTAAQHVAVEMKSEIERIREQIQNIE
ncbi:MAG: YicC family protein [Chrysiogenetes bacterium]|nr:YicC family protein [Chrysiogenetes bacterium]